MPTSASNLYRQFQALIPQPALQVGIVSALVGDIATVVLPGGGVIQARGASSVASVSIGQRVFVRDGVIEGAAPNLPLVVIEI
jgi:hypothetical protein